MPEITIKYKSEKTFQVLQDLARYFDFVIVKPKAQKTLQKRVNATLPIVFSENPDVTALAGIWKDKDITLEYIRKKAWGNRL
jgi:hypothetical protein